MMFKGALNKVNNQRGHSPRGSWVTCTWASKRQWSREATTADQAESTRSPLCFTCSEPMTAHMPKTERQPSRGRRTSGRQSTRAASRASQNLATQSTAVTEPPASDQELNPAVLAQLLQVIRTEVATGIQAQQPGTTTSHHNRTNHTSDPACSGAGVPARNTLPATSVRDSPSRYAVK